MPLPTWLSNLMQRTALRAAAEECERARRDRALAKRELERVCRQHGVSGSAAVSIASRFLDGRKP